MSDIGLKDLEPQRDLYKAKNLYLGQFCEPVEPLDFYRDIFPEGSFERKGHYEDSRGNGIAISLPPSGKGNGIALELQGGGKARRFTVTDDLDTLHDLQHAPFAILAPISYYGKARCGKNARFLYAMVFDVDGVGLPQLRDLLHQMKNRIIPTATYIVNSGTGLHLYYVLDEPVPMYPQNQKFLKEVKYALTRRVWNGFTSTIEVPQMQGIMQGFRIVGSCSKLGMDYPVTAFQYGGHVSLDYLVKSIPDVIKERSNALAILKKGPLPLEVAKEKYPDWYERRIVRGEPKGRWNVKRDLYDWWLRRIRTEIKVGHRFYGIMTLAIYAKKCNIDEDELREDAYSLLELYEGKTDSATNHFTEDDIVCALEMYNEDYVTFPRHDIEKLSGIPVPPNKRNGRKQPVHLTIARATRDILHPEGWQNTKGRPKGSSTQHKQIAAYRAEHPNATPSDCIRDTGISKSTIYRWWESELVEQADPDDDLGDIQTEVYSFPADLDIHDLAAVEKWLQGLKAEHNDLDGGSEIG